VGAYLAITLLLGLYFRARSGRSVDDYFVSGRNVSWWLAGTSMVATTFAADTPLVVTGLVYAQGVAGNWIWWSFLLSGMMTVFLFARLWRRRPKLTQCCWLFTGRCVPMSAVGVRSRNWLRNLAQRSIWDTTCWRGC
jgi:Na+/proline symporter